jgi:hypothetical protein
MSKQSRKKAPYGILVSWNDAWHPPDFHELLDGLKLAQADAVAKECRRLGAIGASVSKAASLRICKRNETPLMVG